MAEIPWLLAALSAVLIGSLRQYATSSLSRILVSCESQEKVEGSRGRQGLKVALKEGKVAGQEQTSE
eukprot:217902-Chlamydomonas_euryale.AAC.5